MNRNILIKLDDIQIKAELNESITADKILDSLPIESVGNLWGEEVYFRTDIVSQIDETAKVAVEIGDIAFWPPSNAICIFYGKTPVSTETEIKPASAVNIIGKVISDIECLKQLKDGAEIKVTRLE